MHIAVLKEARAGEARVALTPDVVSRLLKEEHTVRVPTGAGVAAGALDAAYEAAGAKVCASTDELLEGAQLVVALDPPSPATLATLPRGSTLASFLWPMTSPEHVRALCERGMSAFAMDLVPRITRAQSMDALSSMSTVAGYRAALLAAQHLGRFFPMLMTAAGTIPPSRVVVCGVGVAGLQAIATCRRLGAIVEAYDIRAEARDQAKSLGAHAIEVALEEQGEGEGGYARELSKEGLARLEAALAAHVKKADAVITTALIPGRPAPRLIDAETVAAMRPGAVIVDLAAETGGNCALTEADKIVEHQGVRIIGTLNLASTMPIDASRMYAKNMLDVIRHLHKDDHPGPYLDREDEITGASLAVFEGKIHHEGTRARMEGTSA